MSEEFHSALTAALKRLKASDRFESEVRQALRAFTPETVDSVIAYLREKRLLNDERTMEHALVANDGRRAVGAEKLRERLERRGASEALIRNAVAETEASDLSRALALVQNRYGDASAANRAKAGRFLFGRGFSEETIEATLEKHFGGTDF